MLAPTLWLARQRMSAAAPVISLGYDDAFTPAELLKLHPELNGSVLMFIKEGVYCKSGDSAIVFSHPYTSVSADIRDVNRGGVKTENLYVFIHENDTVFNKYRIACLFDGLLKITGSGIRPVEWNTFRDFTVINGTIKGSYEAMFGSGYTLYPIENYNWIKMPMVLPPDYAGSYAPPPGLIDLCGKGECCLDLIYVAKELPSFMGGGFAKTHSLRYYYNEWLGKRSAGHTSTFNVAEILSSAT